MLECLPLGIHWGKYSTLKGVRIFTQGRGFASLVAYPAVRWYGSYIYALEADVVIYVYCSRGWTLIDGNGT